MGSFTLTHQRTLGHQGATNTTTDRRSDSGVFKIDAGGFHSRLGCGNLGFCLLEGGLGSDFIQLANRLDLAQGSKAVILRFCFQQIGTGYRQRGFSLMHGSQIG